MCGSPDLRVILRRTGAFVLLFTLALASTGSNPQNSASVLSRNAFGIFPDAVDSRPGLQENLEAASSELQDTAGFVRISPSPTRRDAAAGHPLYLVLSVTNLGEEADTYAFALAGNRWPVTLLSADTLTKVTSTGSIAAGGQFTLVVQIDVPNTAQRGAQDSTEILVASTSDSTARDSALIATTSLGPAAELPFVESFASTTLNPARWLDNIGPALINGNGLQEPSPPYALNFDGANRSGDLVQTQPINLGNKRDAVLRFSYERGGSGNAPEIGDDFIVEYHNTDGEWLRLVVLPGAGLDSVFHLVSVILPVDAYHSSFRLRFHNIATLGPFDNWFLDDVQVADLQPSRIPFADDFPQLTLDRNKWPQSADAVVSTLALNLPSPPYALRLPGGSILQSAPLDLSAENSVSLRYQFQQTGGGEEPDAGDDLVIEFRDALGVWHELARHPGSEGGLPVFTRKEVILPAEAYHGNFRLRLRSTGSPNLDDWFVDDLVIDVFAPSDIEVFPTQISLKLFEGDTTSREFSIRNLGVGDLFYRIRIAPPDFPKAQPRLTSFSYPEDYFMKAQFTKAEADWRRGNSVLAGRGGPDNFGYIWIDSDETNGPEFSWVDISSTGVRIPDVGDDDNVGPFNIGFVFPFYDSLFTTFRFCSNGFISFTSNSSAFSNNPIPTLGGADLVAPFWDDLDVQAGAAYYHADSTRLIVQWDRAVRPGGSAPFSFQAILTPEGNIVFQYLEVGEPSNFGTVGIQAPLAVDGVEIAFNTNYVKDSLAVLIQRPASWLAIAPKVGKIASNTTERVRTHFSAINLSPDSTYRAELRVESNDLDEPSVSVELVLEVLSLSDSVIHFPDPTVTDRRYPILIDNASINGEPLAAGDEIAVYTPAGILAGVAKWKETPPARLVAYGDDDSTQAVEGFADGETMYFRIWDSSRNDRDYPATPMYTLGDGSFGTGDSARISVLTAQTAFTRSRMLPAEWSWVSFNVAPTNPNIREVFRNTASLRIVKNGAGQAYIPNVANMIGNLNPLDGYSVYLDAVDSVSIIGEEVPPFTPIPLSAGWNFVGYLPANRIEASQAVASVADKILIVKNDQGGFLLPELGLNTMGDMVPGQGYKMYLNQAAVFTYPIGGSGNLSKPQSAMRAHEERTTTHFTDIRRTSDSYIAIVTSAIVNGAPLHNGDEIAIFNANGQLVGASVWTAPGPVGIVAWRREPGLIRESLGYDPGTPMIFRIYRQSDQQEHEARATYKRGNGRFENDAFALVELEGGAVPAEFELQQNYPNPFAVASTANSERAQTTIRYAMPQSGRVMIRVYNVLGQVVRTLRDEAQETGFHAVQWDGRNDRGEPVAAGVYLYRMTAGKFKAVKKVVVR